MAEDGASAGDHGQQNMPKSEENQDEVFVNGEENLDKADNFLKPDYGDSQDCVLPRRSSLLKDSSRRNQRKKTVSFSSMPNEKTVVNAPDCLNYMQNGSELIKVRSNSRQYHRLFTLDQDITEIRWQPSSKKANKARIPIDQIKEVRVGKNTDILRNKDVAGHYPDECAFSVIYGDSFETMDLIANTPDETNIWVTGLTCLLSGKFNKFDPLERQHSRDKWLKEEFDSADASNVGFIDEAEVVRLVKKLNMGLTTVKIQQKLKEMCVNKESEVERRRLRINSSEFINLFKEVSTRPEIYFLLVRYSSSAEYLSTDDILLFLEAEQGMAKVTKEKCLEIIEKYEPSKQGRQVGHLGIDGFTAFLLSVECDIFDPECSEVYQDMTQPLSHYFISSSHRTYLLEDQLKGPSSIEGYIDALKTGCRCVSLDSWDGPTDDEPVVYHGHTLTSKISFQSVIETINEYAFTASEYPVILSIENHCCPKQQHNMVQTMRTVFGDKLLSGEVDENLQYLPSLDSLRRKIIIKCKKLDCEDGDEGFVTDEDEGAEAERSKKNNKRDSIKKKKVPTATLR